MLRALMPFILVGIGSKELLECIRRIEKRGVLETAHRALTNCGQVVRYAVVTGRAERDPSGDLRGALPPFSTFIIGTGRCTAPTPPK